MYDNCESCDDGVRIVMVRVVVVITVVMVVALIVMMIGIVTEVKFVIVMRVSSIVI